ncbi:MAG: alpha/beta hydrolase [Acidimicrobiales bacterium]
MTDAAAVPENADALRGRLVDIGEVQLWVDEQGPTAGDPVVLIAGADSPGFRWTPAIVDRLVADGHRVIRFDHRDCGRSTRFGPNDAYLLDDLTADVVSLLDELEIVDAHVIGRSMGGMIGQLLGIDHPERVRSLTIFGSSPAPGDERLGGPDDGFVEAMTTRLFAGPPKDEAGRIEWLVELDEFLSGSLYPLDRERQIALAKAELMTGWVPETGHGVAVHASPGRLERLEAITVPTLVVHGTADPVFPPAHGRALATGIDGAVLVEVEGLGHEVPDALIEELWPVLHHHLRAAAAWRQ